jgi:hypothetical protein
MNPKTICLRALLSLMPLAAACMAPAQAQSVEPPITKDIVDLAGNKLGNITFEWLTTIAGAITDFDLAGFTEADLTDEQSGPGFGRSIRQPGMSWTCASSASRASSTTAWSSAPPLPAKARASSGR